MTAILKATRTGFSFKKTKYKSPGCTDIILTHPHWDHIGGINLFPNAMVWMQEADFNYFVGGAWQPNGIREGLDSATVFKIIQKNLYARANRKGHGKDNAVRYS